MVDAGIAKVYLQGEVGKIYLKMDAGLDNS